jgi:hypothetical protein
MKRLMSVFVVALGIGFLGVEAHAGSYGCTKVIVNGASTLRAGCGSAVSAANLGAAEALCMAPSKNCCAASAGPVARVEVKNLSGAAANDRSEVNCPPPAR